MNQAKAITKYVRLSPRKARLVADLIRQLPVEEAETQLAFSNNKSGRHLTKTLKSAVANAETQLDLRKEEMKVLEVRIDNGPTYKRSRSKCRGGRQPILKRTSHLTVVVGKE